MMEQACCGDVLDLDTSPPLPGDDDYEDFVERQDYVKSHILAAVIGTNAYPFIDAKTMSGREMWRALKEMYQGKDYKEDEAKQAMNALMNLGFSTKRSNGERFLADFRTQILKMKRNNYEMPPEMVQSMFMDLITHPAMIPWKKVHQRDSWEDTQRLFIQEVRDLARQTQRQQQENNPKFKANKVKGNASCQSSSSLDEKIKKGANLTPKEYKSLTPQQQERLKEIRRRKRAATQAQTPVQVQTIPNQYSTQNTMQPH